MGFVWALTALISAAWSGGAQNVTLLTLHEVAQALGIEPAALLDASPQPPPPEGKAPRTSRDARPRG